MKITKLYNKDRYVMSTLDYATDNGNPIQELTEKTLNRIVNKHNYDGYVIISACRSRFYKKDITEVPREVSTVEEYDIPDVIYTTCSEDAKVTGDKVVHKEALLSGEALARLNNQRTVELKRELISRGFSFLPVYGGFKEEGANVASFEKSFIVFNFDRSGNILPIDKLFDECIDLGVKFNQDSILVKKPDEKPRYVITHYSPNVNIGDTDFEFNGDYTLNDITQMYFTALKKIKDDSKLSPDSKPQRFTLEGVYINPDPISVHEATRRHYLNELF